MDQNNMNQKKQEQEQENHAPNGENQIMQLSHPPIHSAGASTFSPYLSRDQFQHFSHNVLRRNLAAFWAKQYQEIEETVDFKTNRSIPLLRIKKMMKTDENVNKISADAPVLLAKACEIFIKELTIRSWVSADFNRRRTLHRSDIASAVSNTEVFDFLVDTVPREETMEHVNVPYYVPAVPMQPQFVPVPPMQMQPQYAAGPSYGPPGMLMGGHVLNQPAYHNMQQLPYPIANPMFPIPKQENDDSTDLPDSEN